MKYNPERCRGIVNNFRALWKEQLPKQKLHLSDEAIWDIFEEWNTCETDEFPKMRNRYDACVLANMQAANNTTEPPK